MPTCDDGDGIGNGLSSAQEEPALTLTFRSDPIQIRNALAQLSQFLAPLSMPVEHLNMIELATAEVLNNVFEHGYRSDRDRPIFLSGTLDADGNEDPTLVVCVRDRGMPSPNILFDADQIIVPPPAELPEGGFGCFLILTLSAKVEQRRIGIWNELRVTFPLG